MISFHMTRWSGVISDQMADVLIIPRIIVAVFLKPTNVRAHGLHSMNFL